MYAVQGITTDYLQRRTLILQDGSSLLLRMYYSTQQYGWFILTLTYKSFTLQGLRITNSPNMLHQFRTQLPFGLACFSAANREPTQLQDFSSGASVLYLLSSTECAQYAGVLALG